MDENKKVKEIDERLVHACKSPMWIMELMAMCEFESDSKQHQKIVFERREDGGFTFEVYATKRTLKILLNQIVDYLGLEDSIAAIKADLIGRETGAVHREEERQDFDSPEEKEVFRAMMNMSPEEREAIREKMNE